MSEEPKKEIILFKEKAKEALQKAKDANYCSLQLRNKEKMWDILEGEVAKEALKKAIEDQEASLKKWKSKGHRFKGKGNKAAHLGLLKGKYGFRARKQNLIVMKKVVKMVQLDQ